MGSSLTIDKHGTSIQDWIQIQDKILQIEFNVTANTHLMVWKIYYDQIDQSINSIPFLFDHLTNNPVTNNNPNGNNTSINNNGSSGNINSLFSNQQAYIVGLVLKQDYQSQQKVDNSIISILDNLSLNVNKKSLQVYINKGIVYNPQIDNKKYQYYTYTYLGKRTKNNIKMTALSYCYKLHNFLNNIHRIKIITGGGVYRNKKLQMGSVVTLNNSCSNNSSSNNNSNKGNNNNKGNNYKNLNQYKYIHLISQLMRNRKNQDNNNQYGERFSLFNYKPKMSIPIIGQNRQNNQKQMQLSIQRQEQSSISNSNISSQGASNSYTNNYINPNTNLNFNQIQPNKSIHIPPIKPPMLKLTLKPYEDVTYQQLNEQQKNQKYDIRGTARHQLKMQKFSNDCSMIIQGLYLSGQKIAKDQQILKKYKITDIVNCAGDYCLNWFENVKNSQNQLRYNYLTYFLKDSQNQNIQCLFYRTIDFINNALSNKRNVLVHCIQGISRSVTFVIAYLIFTNGFDYKRAESFVKDRRGIACPNNGFMVQLIQFYKRLHQKYISLSAPRVFLVSYHCQETPQIVTARMIKQRLFQSDGKKYIGLDDRGIYIIHAEQILYIWVGRKCQDQKKMKKYWNYAQSYLKKLQQHEKAPLKVKAINQGNEGQDFLSLWNLQQIPKQYQNNQYDRLFNQQKPIPKAGYLRKHYQRQQDHVQQQFISKLFIFPDFQNGLGVFEPEDLSGLSLLVKSDNQKVKVFVWKSQNWQGQQGVDQQFLDNVIKTNYASYQQENIQIAEEEGSHLQDLSEQFLACFA